MPDLTDFSITVLSNANVNLPRAQISAKVVDSANQSLVLADFTGANAIIFPAVLSTLSVADRRELAQMIASWLIMRRAGLG